MNDPRPLPSTPTNQCADGDSARPATTHMPMGPASPPPPPGGPRYGRFAVQRFHAKGGLGEVHLATDEELGRDVALKRMQERCANDPSARRRFLNEAEIT